MSVRIICINKDNGNHYNRHEAIEYFGWLNESTQVSGKSSLEEMIKFLRNGNTAYVVNRYNNSDRAYLYINSRNGREFLQTYADGQWSDNLLQLDECSA